MLSKILILSLITFTYGQSNICSEGLDLLLILDSSSSVGLENFQLVRDFSKAIIKGLDVSPKKVRVSISRFTTWLDVRTYLSNRESISELEEVVDNTPYYGKGTFTGTSLRLAVDQILQKSNGWREQKVPTVAIIVTDGKADDPVVLQNQASRLRANCSRVIAIGAGTDINATELTEIATRPASENVITLDSYDDLKDQTTVDNSLAKVCAVAADDNECLTNNGNCNQRCINTVNSVYCECRPGYALGSGGLICSDIDECLTDNGGCQQVCENEPGSYKCECEEEYLVSEFGKNCVRNSCYENLACAQTCNNIVGGDYSCSCRNGFLLDDDKRGCTDIDECAEHNGGCESVCVNTQGSYECQCPIGFGLRVDNRTCGVQCYSCDHALSNSDCLKEVVCGPNELSCQTTTRRENGKDYISKHCKQTEACANNFIQNPRTAASPTQCNVNSNGSSVCRCCCHTALCNVDGNCSVSSTIDIDCPDPFDLFFVDEDANLTCSDEPYELGDTCTLQCQPGFGPLNGQGHLVCTQEPRTVNGKWDGMLAACADINECETSNGECSHTCTNTNGSYICSCPGAKACADQPVDLFFILDSSSSVGQTNWDMMIQFVSDVGNRLDIGLGEDQVRVGALTFNRRAIKRFDFNQVNSSATFEEKLKSIKYEGSGTRTGNAIDRTIRRSFSVADGRRPGVPLSVVIITDGRSQDAGRLPHAAAALDRVADEVLVLGVTDRVNVQEIKEIADNNPSNYRLVDDFSNLDGTVSSLIISRLCTQPEQQQVLTSNLKSCDFDECTLRNGGCSDSCVNTVGSYMCTCPEGQVISNDRLNCIPNECAVENGECEEGCENYATGKKCYCFIGKELFDETRCRDYDECSDENGGCAEGCLNIPGGFTCTCPPGLYLASDGINCIIDSCFNQVEPNKCAQNCTNIENGEYTCSCMPGFILGQDGHNCTDIDECATSNGGCEDTCVNTPGSYRCECPAGLDLREDGRTCGIVCYSCQDVLTNDECDKTVSCSFSQDSCYATMRTRNNITRISKGCQQTMACINNMIQNPRSAGEGPSQCNTHGENSKCECCCIESLCNTGVCPYNYTLPGCPIFAHPDITFRGLQGGNEVSPGGVAIVICEDGYVFSQNSSVVKQLNCIYNFENSTSAWDGDSSSLDICIDIDECTTGTHECEAPATCENLEGTYECICPDTPDDYVLVDGKICERDECADIDKGGCTDNCTNTVGGYICSCPARQVLAQDNRTCVEDVCFDGNGGCEQECASTLSGKVCSCVSGYALASDGYSCNDVNECLTDNGGCEKNCTNMSPGYACSCDANELSNNDGFTCRDNPCYVDNGGCSQNCTVLPEGFRCSCLRGFNLLDDGSCEDINECARGNGGCQYNCTNTEGSFFCTCPQGQALRPNGRTCGRACYSCNGAKTNAECNARPLEICPDGADSCENEVRENGNQRHIFKRCKQTQSCNNNFRQNRQPAWTPTQCNPGSQNDVCRCCCTGHLCNSNERPCASQTVCRIPQADVVIVADSSSSVKFDNFQIMKSFISSLLQSFNLGQDAVHTALLRYNRDVDPQFDLGSSNSKQEVADQVSAMPYRGAGTNTGKALQYVLDTVLTAAGGARGGIPQIVVTITDGMSQDSVSAPSAALRAKGVITFAVGIGNVDRSQLMDIAGSAQRLFIADNFADLSGVLLDNVTALICQDNDECASSNGGCAQNCTNVPGSYQCSCIKGYRLADDLHTCIQGRGRSYRDRCAVNNGGCSGTCTNTLGGVDCGCKPGFELQSNGVACTAIDYCPTANCSFECVNTAPGYYCFCPINQVLSTVDNRTCIDRVGGNGGVGGVDCPANFTAVGHSCMAVTADAMTNDEAVARCQSLGATLANLNNVGLRRSVQQAFGSSGNLWFGLTKDADDVWQNQDGTTFEYTEGWSYGQPSNGSCAYINNYYFSSECSASYQAVCEIPRPIGIVLFDRVWKFGASGFIYMPTGQNMIRLILPSAAKFQSVWWGSLFDDSTTSSTNYIITQTDAQGGDGKGAVGFTLNMQGQQFAASSIVVENYP